MIDGMAEAVSGKKKNRLLVATHFFLKEKKEEGLGDAHKRQPEVGARGGVCR